MKFIVLLICIKKLPLHKNLRVVSATKMGKCCRYLNDIVWSTMLYKYSMYP